MSRELYYSNCKERGAKYMAYPEWVEDRFGDDIPDWAQDRWGDDDDDDE